jgi:hypothetical protein
MKGFLVTAGVGAVLMGQAFAQPAPMPGGQAHPDNMYLSPPPMTYGEASDLRLTTHDGRTLDGRIVGGTLTAHTVFGTRDIDASHLTAFSSQMLALDDGFTHTGSVTLLAGTIRFQDAQGTQTIAAANVAAIQGVLTFGTVQPAQSAGPVGEIEASRTASEIRAVLLGKWTDSQNTAWEFFKDGTVLMRQQLSGHFLVDHRRLKVDIWMFGMQMAQVYDIADVSHDQIVLRQQNSQLILRRTP